MSQCWAYSPDKVRCQLDAGHDIPHTVYVTWSDIDCYEPDKTTHSLTAPVVTSLVTIEPAACVACGHKHPKGECKCGCYEQIG